MALFDNLQNGQRFGVQGSQPKLINLMEMYGGSKPSSGGGDDGSSDLIDFEPTGVNAHMLNSQNAYNNYIEADKRMKAMKNNIVYNEGREPTPEEQEEYIGLKTKREYSKQEYLMLSEANEDVENRYDTYDKSNKGATGAYVAEDNNPYVKTGNRGRGFQQWINNIYDGNIKMLKKDELTARIQQYNSSVNEEDKVRDNFSASNDFVEFQDTKKDREIDVSYDESGLPVSNPDYIQNQYDTMDLYKAINTSLVGMGHIGTQDYYTNPAGNWDKVVKSKKYNIVQLESIKGVLMQNLGDTEQVITRDYIDYLSKAEKTGGAALVYDGEKNGVNSFVSARIVGVGQEGDNSYVTLFNDAGKKKKISLENYYEKAGVNEKGISEKERIKRKKEAETNYLDKIEDTRDKGYGYKKRKDPFEFGREKYKREFIEGVLGNKTISDNKENIFGKDEVNVNVDVDTREEKASLNYAQLAYAKDYIGGRADDGALGYPGEYIIPSSMLHDLEPDPRGMEALNETYIGRRFTSGTSLISSNGQSKPIMQVWDNNGMIQSIDPRMVDFDNANTRILDITSLQKGQLNAYDANAVKQVITSDITDELIIPDIQEIKEAIKDNPAISDQQEKDLLKGFEDFEDNYNNLESSEDYQISDIDPSTLDNDFNIPSTLDYLRSDFRETIALITDFNTTMRRFVVNTNIGRDGKIGPPSQPGDRSYNIYRPFSSRIMNAYGDVLDTENDEGGPGAFNDLMEHPMNISDESEATPSYATQYIVMDEDAYKNDFVKALDVSLNPKNNRFLGREVNEKFAENYYQDLDQALKTLRKGKEYDNKSWKNKNIERRFALAFDWKNVVTNNPNITEDNFGNVFEFKDGNIDKLKEGKVIIKVRTGFNLDDMGYDLREDITSSRLSGSDKTSGNKDDIYTTPLPK